MSRPLRIEFAGACYHVAARGNGGQAIFTCAEDGARFLALLGREVAQQRWLCHGWCLMEDSYQLLLETPEANLGRGMGRLNMAYSQWFGRRHGRSGHLFAERYRAILLEKERWLLPVARHMMRRPVRAGLVRRPEQWHWSSFGAVATASGSDWLATGDILAPFGGKGEEGSAGWRRYVAEGADAPSPWEALRGGPYLGGPEFRRDIARRISGRPLDQVSRAAAMPERPAREDVLAAVAEAAGVPPERVLDRKAAPDAWRAAIYLLRRAANLPLRDTAALAGVSPGRVSQIQRAVDDAGGVRAAFAWGERLPAALLPHSA